MSNTNSTINRSPIDIPNYVPIFFVSGYARTSTLGQAEDDKISIPDQIEWFEKICKERGWKFVGYYVDTLPGDVEFDKRPEGARLLIDSQQKIFNLVLFYHSSRLAREPWVGLKTISLLGKLGIQTYIRNAPIEPVNPKQFIYGSNIGSEYLNALSLVGDKQENIARSERVTSGFKNLAQRGIFPFKLYGLKKIPKIEMLPNGKQHYTWHYEEEVKQKAIILRIFTEYDTGGSLRKIGRGLIKDGIPSPSGKTGPESWSAATLRKILKNQKYIKKNVWGERLGSKYRQGRAENGKQKRIISNQNDRVFCDGQNFPLLIDKQLFYRVQERLKQRGKLTGRQLSTDSPFPGLVYCGDCQRKAYCKTRKVKKKGKVYIRSDFIDQSYTRGDTCRRHLISALKLESLVLAKLQSRLQQLREKDIEKEILVKNTQLREPLESSIANIDKQLKTYPAKFERLLQLFIDGGIIKDVFDNQNAKLGIEESLLNQEKAKFQTLLDDSTKQAEAYKILQELLGMFTKVTDKKVKKEMLSRLIDRVVVYKDHIDILYHYPSSNPNFITYVKPHPCGYLGDNTHECTCAPSQIIRYQKKISGPLLDRIDIHVDIPAVKTEKLTAKDTQGNETSETIRARVQKARDMQTVRFQGTTLSSNADMASRDIKLFCALSDECINLLRIAVDKLHLSARSYYRTIKVARTIADLDGSQDISKDHLAEALQYRPRQDGV